jgi:hypothetical protein
MTDSARQRRALVQLTSADLAIQHIIVTNSFISFASEERSNRAVDALTLAKHIIEFPTFARSAEGFRNVSFNYTSWGKIFPEPTSHAICLTWARIVVTSLAY